MIPTRFSFCVSGTARAAHQNCSGPECFRVALVRPTLIEPPLQKIHRKKSRAERTPTENLEEKFDRGEDVLDYFNVLKARVIRPECKGDAQDKVRLSDQANGRPTCRCAKISPVQQQKNSRDVCVATVCDRRTIRGFGDLALLALT
jgi:hypothetical protein